MNRPIPPHSEDSTFLFRSAWSIYDAIIAQNYLSHREIQICVREVLSARQAAGGYVMLDLGCGNARFLAPCLEEFPPRRYVGVDLSATALAEAAQRLDRVPQVTLHERDMRAEVAALAGESFDLIYSSFAVHHLDPAGKREIFRAGAALLAPGGEFLMIDVVREPGQTREQYLEAYLHWMRTEWTAIPRIKSRRPASMSPATIFPRPCPSSPRWRRPPGWINHASSGALARTM